MTKPFNRIYVDLIKAIAIFMPGILADAVTDSFVSLAPPREARVRVDVVFIRQDPRPWGDRSLDQGGYRGLLDIGGHLDGYFPRTLDHAEDRGLLLV